MQFYESVTKASKKIESGRSYARLFSRNGKTT